MRCNLSGPLAAVLLLAVASVPCPASWLDDTTHNVGVEAILAPRGTIDSGEAVTPIAVVANYGTSAESLWAFMAINEGTPGGYFDSLWLTGLAPAQRETVAFLDWTPRGRDSMTATAWTVCADDTFPQDDTAKAKFLVRVKSIEIHILVPQAGDTFDSGVVITPQCRVTNTGNVSLNVDLRFCLHPGGYPFVRNLNLIAGGSTVASGLPFTTMPGQYFYTVEALPMAADTSYFWVRGGAGVDEEANGERRMANSGASVLRRLPPGAVVFDAMGRRVLNPRPGVYFLAEGAGANGQGSGRIRKVILQR